MKKALVVFSLAFAAFLALVAIPVAVSAQKVDLEGTGALWAKGTGKAELEGKLNFHGRARGAVLVVEDEAGDATIDVHGYGRRIDEGNGKVRYVGFNGRAHIEGSQVKVSIEGREIRLVVYGKCEATLRGKGVYRVKGGEVKPWTSNGTTTAFDDTTAAPESSAN